MACPVSNLKVKFSYSIVTNQFCTATKVSCAAISGHLQFQIKKKKPKRRISSPMLLT